MYRIRKRLMLSALLALLATIAAGCQPVRLPVTASTETSLQSTGTARQAGQNIVSPTDPLKVQIQNALSALPAGLTEGATVYGFPAEGGGDMVLLKQGNNGWSCYTDWPQTWGNDPQCNDAIMDAWMGAYAAGSDPQTDHVGFSYMLQGAVDASATDPTATAPAEGEDWLVTPPHVHIILPGGYTAGQFPAEPKIGQPFIIWPGTPYELLHVPVELTPFDEPDPKIRDAMSAGPIAITKDAEIVDYPRAGETEPIVLREGSNGWTCWVDWAVTPTDDPMCVDETWMKMMDAQATGADFKADRLGVGYMLQGGTSPSNTNPMALEPAAGERWQIDPPHVMFIVPEDLDPSYISTDPASGGPYIMFEGTPYEHVMTPVNTGDPEQVQTETEFLQAVLDFEQDFQSGDGEAFLSHYADDVLSIPPGRALMDLAAVRADIQIALDTYTMERTFKLEDYTLVGNYGTRIGSWTNVLTPKAGGDPISETGHCIVGFEKIDGEWKVVWEIWNTMP
jgi:ketosteroid isomerase-like protein